jgi:hypothetical protein
MVERECASTSRTDGWFGNITATIDSAGRLRGTLPLYTQANSYTGFGYIAGRTFYTRRLVSMLCATLALVCLVAERVA